MLMKMIWWHRFWCVRCEINEPTRRLTVKPSFHEGEMPSILALLLYIPRWTQASRNMEDFNPYLSFKSWSDISVPLSPLLTWSMPFNPVSLIFLLASCKLNCRSTWRRQICLPLPMPISWFLLQLCSFDCLKTKTFQMERPELVNISSQSHLHILNDSMRGVFVALFFFSETSRC